MTDAENTNPKQRGRPFQAGVSGNPNGRPKGSRNRVTILAEQLVDGVAEEVVNKIIEHALHGEPNALKLLMDRILPVRKDRPTPFQLPPIETAKDLPTAMASITQAVADGDLTLLEAAEASRLVENYARTVEVTEVMARLDALEQEKARQS